jgi:hypothetical protein
MANERRVIMLGQGGAAELDHIEDLAIRVQVETGMRLDRGPSETRPSGIVRHAWRERRPYAHATATWMILTTNPEIPACWLEILCDDRHLADRIDVLARETLRAPTWQELVAAANASPRATGAITRLALGAPSTARPAVLLAVQAGLRAPFPANRMDAALAAVSGKLQEARAAIDQAITSEDDQEVLATLQWAASALPEA